MSKKVKPELDESQSQVRSRKSQQRFASIERVQQVCEETDKLLVVYQNKVYDVSKFQYEHPGGSDVLEDYQGQDIADIFHNSTRHRHSQYALNLMQKYLIGEIGAEIQESSHGSSSSAAGGSSGASGEYPKLTADDNLIYEKVTLNLNKGLLKQIASIKDRATYDHILQNPCKRKVGSLMFDNSVLDMLFNNNIGIAVMIYLLFFIFLIFNAVDLRNNYSRGLFDKHIKKDNMPITYVALLFSAGLFAFWVMEYLYLRVIIQPFVLGKTFHFAVFGAHYLFPLDRTRTTIQPIFSVTISLAIRYTLGMIVYGNTLYLLLSGMCFGYLMYEIIHYAIHNKETLTFAYSRTLRARHSKHHFKNRNYGFQVTNHFWDKFFELRNLEEEDERKKLLEKRAQSRRIQQEKEEREQRGSDEGEGFGDDSDSD